MALFIGGPRHGARSPVEQDETIREGDTLYTRMYVVHHHRDGIWRITAYASGDVFGSAEVFEHQWNDLLGKGIVDAEIRNVRW